MIRVLRRLLRGEAGEVSVIELLVGAALMLLAIGGSLTVLETAMSVDRETTHRNEAQDEARTSLDRLARQLRNLASPTPSQPQAIDRATAYDVVFQSVDPEGPNAGANLANVRRLRWCLDDPTNDLYLQTQTWTGGVAPAIPSLATCRAAPGWTTEQVVVHDLVNRAGGQHRPLFSFDSTVLTDISSVHAELFVDRDPGRGARETRLSTGVFLRNQNRRPVAAFTASRSAQGLVLNGSLSTDPEGQGLTFRWYDGGVEIGTGVVFTYPAATGSAHSISLEVSDPSGLEGASEPQEVTA